MPLVCKVTDFGETRSQNNHTHTVLSSKATHVSRETFVLYLGVWNDRCNESWFKTSLSNTIFPDSINLNTPHKPRQIMAKIILIP